MFVRHKETEGQRQAERDTHTNITIIITGRGGQQDDAALRNRETTKETRKTITNRGRESTERDRVLISMEAPPKRAVTVTRLLRALGRKKQKRRRRRKALEAGAARRVGPLPGGRLGHWLDARSLTDRRPQDEPQPAFWEKIDRFTADGGR